jgi:hypothetical protein
MAVEVVQPEELDLHVPVLAARVALVGNGRGGQKEEQKRGEKQ